LSEAKPELRRVLRARINAIGPEERAAWSAAIGEHLARVLAPGGSVAAEAGMGVVLAFWPMPGEPDVRGVISELLGAGRVVCLPRVDWARGTMEAAAIPTGVHDAAGVSGALARGRAEPHSGLDRAGQRGHGPAGVADVPPSWRRVEACEIGVVVVPGLGFGVDGGRVGRGGGFYDRYLGRGDAGGAVRVGVCFGVQVAESVPMAGHDARVDWVVTEAGVRRCTGRVRGAGGDGGRG
jgi:5-formyltetrahydrofolate cyclo-ligase